LTHTPSDHILFITVRNKEDMSMAWNIVITATLTGCLAGAFIGMAVAIYKLRKING